MRRALAVIFFIVFSYNAFSQEDENSNDNNMDTTADEVTSGETSNYEYVFNEGDLFLNLGVTFGYYSYFDYAALYPSVNRSITPPITLSGEYAVHEMFGAGAFIGYHRRKYTYTSSYYTNWWSNAKETYKYTDKYTYLNYGVYGSAHLVKIANEEFDADIESDKIDIYASLVLGFRTYTYTYSSNDPQDRNYRGSSSATDLSLGGVAGARYMFQDNLGVFFELGRGYSGWLQLGLTFKP